VTRLQLDGRAAAAFDARAESLMALVQVVAVTPQQRRWEPEVVVKAQLGPDDVQGEIEMTSVGLDGVHVATRFASGDEMCELGGEGYSLLRKLAEQVARVPTLRESISSVAVEHFLRRWVRDRHRKSEQRAFTEVMLQEFTTAIRSFSIWLPVQRLHVEQDLSFGVAWLRNISKSMIDSIVEASPEQVRPAKEHRLRPFQGHAAVVIECVAEPERAIEVSLERAEAVLAALSPFSSGAAHCTAGSSIELWGVQRRRMASALFFVDDRLQGSKAKLLEPDSRNIAINKEFLQVFGAQLVALKWLLEHATAGSLAELVVDSLRVYRRATLTGDPAEKITFVFAALEMVLVDGNKEPIQESIAVRLAFLVGDSLPGRKEILATIRKAYSLRSAFVHHGAQIEDVNLANQLLKIALLAMLTLVSKAQQFAKPADLILALDERKLQ
jgi:hypothetical protein